LRLLQALVSGSFAAASYDFAVVPEYKPLGFGLDKFAWLNRNWGYIIVILAVIIIAYFLMQKGGRH
jgi:hypothetical protein